MKAIEKILSRHFNGKVFFNENLANHTTWKIGGAADVLVIPSGTDDIRLCLEAARESGFPVTVLGNGSNVLVLDGGIRGMVIKIAGAREGIEIQGTRIAVRAGTFLPRLSEAAARAGLSGLEFAVGIPGTLGGAVVMNAGTKDRTIGELLEAVWMVTLDGEKRLFTSGDMKLSYRNSIFQQTPGIVVGAILKLLPDEEKQIRKRMNEEKAWRKERQPLKFPCAGSVFKNPSGNAAGFLIESCGCKGIRSGGAQVATEHSNFIVNLGGATAKDVLNLIGEVKQKVREKFGITLKEEIKILGEE